MVCLLVGIVFLLTIWLFFFCVSGEFEGTERLDNVPERDRKVIHFRFINSKLYFKH